MPDTIGSSPATSRCSFGQFRRLGTAADGAAQALEIQVGLCDLRGGRRRALEPHENRAVANTPSTAVQHDRSSRQAGHFCRLRRMGRQPGPVVHRRRLCASSRPSSAAGNIRPVPSPSSHDSADAAARLMLVVSEPGLGPHLAGDEDRARRKSRRSACASGPTGLATVTLFAVAFLQRRTLRVPSAAAAAHLVVAGSLNVAAFTLLAAFAQLVTTTSRVTVLTYTMPIWAALLRVPRPRRAAHVEPRHLVVALRRRIGGADLSAHGIGRPDRALACTHDRRGLGSRHGLPEVGANRRRSAGDRGVAGIRRPRDHSRRARDIRRVAAPLAGSRTRASGGGLFRGRRLRRRLSACGSRSYGGCRQ